MIKQWADPRLASPRSLCAYAGKIVAEALQHRIIAMPEIGGGCAVDFRDVPERVPVRADVHPYAGISDAADPGA
jgi:hypothetical protein